LRKIGVLLRALKEDPLKADELELTIPEVSDLSVLIVDDDMDVCELVDSACSLIGVTTTVVGDGSQAIGIFDELHEDGAIAFNSPDLILLDVMMPQVGGLETLKNLRARPWGKYIPVVMLTALDRLDDKVAAFEAGADDYLCKPFQFKELQARVKAWLRVRALYVALVSKHHELLETQELVVELERRQTVQRLTGTAAHALGQPLSALLLNAHLLKRGSLSAADHQHLIEQVAADGERMKVLLEELRAVRPDELEAYHDGIEILSLPSSGSEPQKR
jgi:DNA-binding response OmpR family regulator